MFAEAFPAGTFSVDGQTLLAILGMAAATYLVRVGGFALLRNVPAGSFLDTWLKHVPGAMFAAMLAPALVSGGPAEWAGAAAILAAARFGLPLPLVLAFGVGTVLVGRILVG